MNKQTLLLDLQTAVEENWLIPAQYVGKKNGFICYCAVGHLMKAAGVDMDEVKQKANEEPLVNVNVYHYNLLEPLYEAGFSRGDLERLQWANDEQEEYGLDKLRRLISELLREVAS